MIEVTLRPYSPEDVEPYFRAVRESILELTRWLAWCDESYSWGQAAKWVDRAANAALDEDGESHYVIEVEGKFAGSISLDRLDKVHRKANVGYWVRTSMAGQGIATAALERLTLIAMEALGIHRLEIFMSTKNSASKVVAQKVGARYEAILEERLCYDGVWENAYLFALIHKEDEDAAP